MKAVMPGDGFGVQLQEKLRGDERGFIHVQREAERGMRGSSPRRMRRLVSPGPGNHEARTSGNCDLRTARAMKSFGSRLFEVQHQANFSVHAPASALLPGSGALRPSRRRADCHCEKLRSRSGTSAPSSRCTFSWSKISTSSRVRRTSTSSI